MREREERVEDIQYTRNSFIAWYLSSSDPVQCALHPSPISDSTPLTVTEAVVIIGCSVHTRRALVGDSGAVGDLHYWHRTLDV